MATTVATVIGFVQAVAILRRIKSAVQRLRTGKIAKLDIDLIRREIGGQCDGN